MSAKKSGTPTQPAGVFYAIFAALLFGISTPFSKILIGQVTPVLLAGLLYIGSGIGLTILYFSQRRDAEAPLVKSEIPWVGGAVLFGGVLGPVLLMLGLKSTPASTAALLLNLEAVFTALLAWSFFRENVDRRIAIGMVLIVAGGVVLSWQSGSGISFPTGSLAIIGACLCWGLDNNLTQKVSANNPYQVAAIKGAVAGCVNLIIAFCLGAKFPAVLVLLGALVVGFLGYGLSLSLFVRSLRFIGTARTGAYFSIAPFAGALIAFVVLREQISGLFIIASALMAIGVWLHLTENHAHKHTHESMVHSHSHIHDEHHQHEHALGIDPHEPHTHQHTHEPMTHTHAHYPDIHHRHQHIVGKDE
ncbi:MAG: DMT family transporter [Chthonomonadales bacterium]